MLKEQNGPTTAGVEKILLAEPQGICDIIGSAFRVWRQNFGFIVKVLLAPTIVLTVCNTLFQWLVTYGPGMTKNLFYGVLIFIAGMLVSLAWLVIFYIVTLRELAIVRLLCGFAPDWDSSYKFMRKRLWWMVGLSALGFFGAILALLFLGVILGISTAITTQGPAGVAVGSMGVIVSCFGMGLVFIALLLLFHMGEIVIALEDINFWDVVGRTLHWTMRNFGRCLCFGAISYVVLSAVAVPLQLPVMVATMVDLCMHAVSLGYSEGYKVPVYLMVFNQIWAALLGILLRPVTVLCFAYFYLDLRRRTDGFDIEHRLQLLKKIEAR